MSNGYRILSLDGGGVRGLLTARVLERLSERNPLWLESVDLLAGTSTGGIIALGLASGLKPADLVALYRDNADAIFERGWLAHVVNPFAIAGAKYEIEPLRRILVRTFGRLRLRDLGRKVLIVTFDLDRPPRLGSPRSWGPKLFHNFDRSEDLDELVVDVALRTSAAPTFFPSVAQYVDGGVAMNNPTLCGITQAVSPVWGRRHLSELRVLSAGCGLAPVFIEGRGLRWGLTAWAPWLVRLLMDGSSTVVDHQSRVLLGMRYHRLQAVLPRDIPLDSAGDVPALLDVANGLHLDESLGWLAATWQGVRTGPGRDAAA